jgi:protein-tyrosine phosphatase
MIDRVLVVCVGNICRSPMAEALLRARLARRPRFEVSSAGLSALVDHPAAEHARDLLAERGIDISSHRARQVTPQLVSASDLILVMEAGHEQDMLRTFPQAWGKVHRIGRFGNFEVEDPHRRGRAAFTQALSLIERGIADFERVLWPPRLRKVHG